MVLIPPRYFLLLYEPILGKLLPASSNLRQHKIRCTIRQMHKIVSWSDVEPSMNIYKQKDFYQYYCHWTPHHLHRRRRIIIKPFVRVVLYQQEAKKSNSFSSSSSKSYNFHCPLHLIWLHRLNRYHFSLRFLYPLLKQSFRKCCNRLSTVIKVLKSFNQSRYVNMILYNSCFFS